jgi:hypothetical protein
MSNYLSSRVHGPINGPHNAIFFRHVSLVESAINQMRLKSVVPVQAKEKAKANVQMSLEPFWWKYGGMRVPHLHFKDQVYMLNDEQWKTFSKSLLGAFKTQLEKANTVSFENAQTISDDLENVGM